MDKYAVAAPELNRLLRLSALARAPIQDWEIRSHGLESDERAELHDLHLQADGLRFFQRRTQGFAALQMRASGKSALHGREDMPALSDGLAAADAGGRNLGERFP
jgi:hypothetical protein